MTSHEVGLSWFSSHCAFVESGRVYCCYVANSKNKMPIPLCGYINPYGFNDAPGAFLVCECVTYDGVIVWLLFAHSFEMVNAVSQGNQY